MTRNLLSSAVFAGVLTGLVAVLLHFLFVTPLLLEGELYESGERIHFATDGSTQSERGAPALAADMGRHAITAGFNMVTFSGYALVLLALMTMARDRVAATITPRTGLIWGLCGFIVMQLAPAVGLPPELPGTPAAELAPRQIWWAATAVATAIGLGLIAFGRGTVMPILGIVLILAPHFIGAPHLDTYFGVAPPELSAEFATRSLGVAAFAWTMLGWACAYFFLRGETDAG